MYAFLISTSQYMSDCDTLLGTLRRAMKFSIERDLDDSTDYDAPYRWLMENSYDHYYTVRPFKPEPDPNNYQHGHAVFLCLNEDHRVAMEFALLFNRTPFSGTCGLGWID